MEQTMNLAELKEAFPTCSLSWRLGATNSDKTMGMAIAYVNARDVMERLDLVCGPENWQAKYPFVGCCEIGLRINNEWVWKANGAGETDIEGEKGQYSDAFKRAAVLWGIGQYLYSVPSEWVKIVKRGKSYAIADSEFAALARRHNDFIKTTISPKIKKETYSQTIKCLSDGDEHGLREIWAEFTNEEQVLLWPLFNSSQRTAIKELLR